MRFFYLLLLSCLALFQVNAQIDTSFWFVAPATPPALSNSPIQLHFSSYANPTTIRVRQPANVATGVDLTFTLAANSTTAVVLTPSIAAVLAGASNTVSNKGLYISSTQKISSYFSIGSGNNKEMLSLKGTRAAGTDFYAPFPTTLPTLTTGAVVGDVSLDVVATQTGVTTILITPRANCVAHAQNVTFSKLLNYGETFSLRDLGTSSPSQMAGTIVSSDKKIAITISGATGNSTVCPSFYSDQITNSSEVGKDYVIHNGNSTTNVAYILAPLNSTSLTITSGTVTNWLINSGETFTVNTSAANLSFIQANKPVYVFHVSGFGCKLGGAQVTPAYCAGSYSTAFSRLTTDSMYIDMYIRSGFEGAFTLTANAANIPVSAASFTPVTGSAGNLVGARIFYTIGQIPVGAHVELKNSLDVFGSAMHNGSTLAGVGYGYTTEFGTSSFVYANTVPQATICSNTTFTLNGVVGGGPVAGQWSTNGYGTFSGGPNLLTNNIYTPGLLDTVNKPIKIILTSLGFCPNKSDTLKLYVKQGPIVNAGSDQLKCTNNATFALNGNVIGGATSGTWSPVAPANGTITNSSSLQTTYFPSNADTALNYIKIILTSINNGICAAEIDTVKIDFQKAPLVKAAPTSSLIRCTNNSTVFLSGYISSNITSGIWTTSGSGVFIPNNISLTNNYLPSPTDMVPPGPIKLKLTTPPNSLCKAVSDSVFVYFTDPAIISAGIDLNSCKNNPVITLTAVVTGTSAGGVVWTGGTGSYAPSNTVVATTYTASATEVTNGSVLLTVTTTSNGICFAASDQVKVNFQNQPTAIFNPNTVCLNIPTKFVDQSVNQSNGSLNAWTWDFGDGQTSTLNGTVSNVYSNPGTYTAELVVVDTYGCRDSTTRMVTVFPLPTVKMGISRNCSGSAQNICFSDSSSVIAPSTLTTTGFYWDFGGAGFSVTKDTCFVFPTQGKYSITHNVTTIHGCTAAIVQTLNITPPPKALFFTFVSSAPSLASFVEFSDSSSNSVGWFWDFNNGLTSNLQFPTTIYTANGIYTVQQTVTDQFGCQNTYTAIVKVNNLIEEITELIPNVISPNGDGKNDFWRLDFIDLFYPKAEIEIFNRWGESIFRSTGYSNAWDGSYKGTPLPVGAYYYTLDLKDPDKPGIIKGNITLIK